MLRDTQSGPGAEPLMGAPEAECFSWFGRLLSILNVVLHIHFDIGGIYLATSLSHADLPLHERTADLFMLHALGARTVLYSQAGICPPFAGLSTF